MPHQTMLPTDSRKNVILALFGDKLIHIISRVWVFFSLKKQLRNPTFEKIRDLLILFLSHSGWRFADCAM